MIEWFAQLLATEQLHFFQILTATNCSGHVRAPKIDEKIVKAADATASQLQADLQQNLIRHTLH
jgi:hypothetical protein